MAKGFNEKGEELIDDTPVEIPVALRKVVDIRDEMLAYVQTHLSRMADEAGEESFEESEDFEVDDDPAPIGEHELSDLEDRLSPGEWRRMIGERIKRDKEVRDNGQVSGAGGAVGGDVVGGRVGGGSNGDVGGVAGSDGGGNGDGKVGSGNDGKVGSKG